jgi:hypothetical protein
LHAGFKALRLYGIDGQTKVGDIHNHPTDYSGRGRTQDGAWHIHFSTQVLRQQLERMDETGIATSVLMGIPLKQGNTTRHPDALPYSVDVHATPPLLINVDDRSSQHSDPTAVGPAISFTRASSPPNSGGTPVGSSAGRSVFSDELSACGNLDPATYYMDNARLLAGDDPSQHSPLYYYSQVDGAIAMAYKGLSAQEKKRFYPMITAMNVADDTAWHHMYSMLTTYPKTFVGTGEFTVHKEFVENQVAGEPACLGLMGLHDCLKFAGQVGIFATVHNDIEPKLPSATLIEKRDLTDQEYHAIKAEEAAREASPEPQAYLAPLKQVFKKHPQTTIVWAHGAGLGRFVTPRDGHLQMLEEFLTDPELRHVYIDISWDKLAAHMNASPETLRAWAALLNRFPNRFVFGSDALTPLDGAAYGKTFRDYQTLRSLLNDGVFEMIFKKNLKNIAEVSIKNRDSWERAGSPELQRGHNGLYRPDSTGALKKIKRRAGDLNAATASRMSKAVSRMSTTDKIAVPDQNGGTTLVKRRAWRPHQKMGLEAILDELRERFLADNTPAELARYQARLETPAVDPAAAAADSTASDHSGSFTHLPGRGPGPDPDPDLDPYPFPRMRVRRPSESSSIVGYAPDLLRTRRTAAPTVATTTGTSGSGADLLRPPPSPTHRGFRPGSGSPGGVASPTARPPLPRSVGRRPSAGSGSSDDEPLTRPRLRPAATPGAVVAATPGAARSARPAPGTSAAAASPLTAPSDLFNFDFGGAVELPLTLPTIVARPAEPPRAGGLDVDVGDKFTVEFPVKKAPE